MVFAITKAIASPLVLAQSGRAPSSGSDTMFTQRRSAPAAPPPVLQAARQY
jgi:hypothetical protein